MLRPRLALIFLVLALAASVLQAQEAAPAPSISVESDEPSDTEIEQRLTRIYSEVDGLQGVLVSSEAGVVTLGGQVLLASLADEAEELAESVIGVVTVQNEIRRDTGLIKQISPVLAKLQGAADTVLVGLPLGLLAILIVALFWWFGGWLSQAIYLPRGLRPNPFVGELVRLAIRLLLTVIGILLAAEMLEATALLVSVLGGLGVVGLALGFAIRDTIENFVASVLLSIRQPFGVNEHVAVAKKEGRIVRLTSRATIMLDLDGNHVRIPNSAVYKSTIVNFSRNPKRRFDFDVGIDTDFDPAVAQELAVEALAEIPGMLADPGPSCIVHELGDSNVVLRAYGWVDQREVDFSKTRSAGMAAVKRAFEDAEINMPEPIYRLRVENVETTGAVSNQSGPRKLTRSSTPDLQPDTAVVKQVEVHRDGDDLLDDRAPRE